MTAEEVNANMVTGNCHLHLSVVDYQSLHADPSHQQAALQWLECIDYLEQAMCHNKVVLGLKDYPPFKNPALHKLLQGNHSESWKFPFGA